MACRKGIVPFLPVTLGSTQNAGFVFKKMYATQKIHDLNMVKQAKLKIRNPQTQANKSKMAQAVHSPKKTKTDNCKL